jgi:hypothetical protein
MADFMSVIIPFLFVLAVVYGALEVSDIFKRKQVKLIISLCFALVAMSSALITGFIMGILPYAILLFIAFFFIGFALSFFREDKKEGGKGERDYTLIAIVLVLLLLFLSSYGTEFIEDMIPGMSRDSLVTGIGIIVILMVFYAAYKLSGKKE